MQVSMLYPSDHHVAERGVAQFIEIMAQHPTADDDAFVEMLVGKGVQPLDAELLLAFVPSAFAWTLFKKMGLQKFPNTFFICDEHEHHQEYGLSSQHYFAAALNLAWNVVTHGYTAFINKSVFQAIATRSAELNATNSALNAGERVEDLTLLPLTLYRIDGQQFASLIKSMSIE